jgi:branched-chain amino acid transport system substrate-binding protein
MSVRVKGSFPAFVILVPAFLFCLTACSSQPSSQQATASKPAIKVGSVFSLTGSFAGVGSVQQRAIALEIERLNSKGGINGQPIQYISYDDQSQAETAGLLVKKLAQQDKVSVILGPTGGWTIMPIKPIIQQMKVPDIASGAITINPDERYLFNLVVGVEMGNDIYLNFAKQHGWTRVASLQTTDDVGDRASAALKSLAAKYGMRIVAEERFNTQDKDVTPQLSKLRAAKPQLLLSWCSGDAAVLVYKNMRQLGMDIPYMPSGGAASSRFFKLIGDVPKPNLLFTLGGKLQVLDSVPDSDPVKASGIEYRKLYMAKYGAAPENVEATAWDLTEMATNALKAVGPDPEKVRDYIETTKMSGLQANYVMKPDDHNGVDRNSVVVLMGLGSTWQVSK